MRALITVTDLETRRKYHGVISQLNFFQNANLDLELEDYPGGFLRIPRLRGWVISDSLKLFYVIDYTGRRFRFDIQRFLV